MNKRRTFPAKSSATAGTAICGRAHSRRRGDAEHAGRQYRAFVRIGNEPRMTQLT
jgi:hypothetical protein